MYEVHRLGPSHMATARSIAAALQVVVRQELLGSAEDEVALVPGGDGGPPRRSYGRPAAASAAGATAAAHPPRQTVRSPRLHIFGSLMNGFGTTGSDIDLAVDLPPGVEAALPGGSFLEGFHHLRRQLRRRGYHVWQFISPGRSSVPLLRLSASVPRAPPMRVDLGFNNLISLANTRLLATYAALDDRVAPLGVGIKLWARARGVNEASSNYLSSYAYILLAIFFLQQPSCGPILPRLQEAALCEEYARETGQPCEAATVALVATGVRDTP